MAVEVSPAASRGGGLATIPVPGERHPQSTPMPAPRTSFVGREQEVALVRALLGRPDVRIVTLTGPGGVGKTRIATQAVAPASRSMRFVDLADIRQPTLVLSAIAAALGIRPDGRTALDQLTTLVRQDDLLLVLDNFEQVLPAAVDLARLLDACRRVRLLVTSRAVLRIPGEHVVDVRPFPLPPSAGAGAGREVAGSDACRLFEERARALDPEFAVSDANAATIVAICRRLDGLPLAIELAASWVPVLSPGTLLAQLDRRLGLPADGSVVVPQRHRSLRETISWSHGLLDAPSQRLFRRVAVFSGGATLDAIRAVCGDDSLEVLQELRKLISNSLVRRTDLAGREPRYTLLETVREFGLERLEGSGDADVIARRHAAWALGLAERVEAELDTVDREAWLDLLEAEQGNLHGALAWALEHEEAEHAVALCGAMLPFWQHRFQSVHGREWVRRALTLRHHVSAAAVRKAVHCAGTLAYMQGDTEEAAAHFADALTLYRDADDPRMTGRVELALGRIAWDADDQDLARSWFGAAEQRFADCGDRPGLAVTLHYLGMVALREGHHARATALLRDALEMWRSLGFTWELTRCIPGHLADVARAEGDLTGAMRLYQECLAVNWADRDLENVSWSLAGLAVIAVAEGEANPAARLMALAETFEELVGAPLTPHILHDHGVALRLVLGAVGEDRFARVLAAERTTDPAAGVGAALAMTRREPVTSPPACQVGPALTPRERDVLRMVASGSSNQAIADALFLSVGTVKVHVTHILAKLEVRSRAAAADYAHRHGFA